jgi:hypothetical protein
MGFMRTFRYEEEKVALDKYTIDEPKRIRLIYNWFQYYSSEFITKELESSGFRVEVHYANATGEVYSEASPEIALVAKKR